MVSCRYEVVLAEIGVRASSKSSKTLVAFVVDALNSGIACSVLAHFASPTRIRAATKSPISSIPTPDCPTAFSWEFAAAAAPRDRANKMEPAASLGARGSWATITASRSGIY